MSRKRNQIIWKRKNQEDQVENMKDEILQTKRIHALIVVTIATAELSKCVNQMPALNHIQEIPVGPIEAPTVQVHIQSLQVDHLV